MAGLGNADSAFAMSMAVVLLPSGGMDCVAAAGPLPDAVAAVDITKEPEIRSKMVVE